MKCDSIELTDGTKIDVDGIFILRPAIAPSTVLPGLEMDGAHIKVGRSQETNFKGCYAAGDCTGRPYQIAKAVGEGNVAAHAILEHLSEIEKES
jgi:thioredoxin reductase (NADPH)